MEYRAGSILLYKIILWNILGNFYLQYKISVVWRCGNWESSRAQGGASWQPERESEQLSWITNS